MTALPFPDALAERAIASCPSCACGAETTQSPWCACVTSEQPPAPRRLAAARPPLVLLVGGDEEVRIAGKHAVEQLGYRCTTAPNGPAALAMMAAEEPRVVIAEAVMPKMNGRDLCRFVKRSSRAKVVLLTAAGAAPRTRHEADEYLPKPIDLAALQATLARMLS